MTQAQRGDASKWDLNICDLQTLWTAPGVGCFSALPPIPTTILRELSFIVFVRDEEIKVWSK